MRMSIIVGLLSVMLFIGFGMKTMLIKSNNNFSDTLLNKQLPNRQINLQNKPNTIKNLALPEGFTRQQADKQSFAAYLQNLPLKPQGTDVLTYTGNIPSTNSSAFAVIDMPVGKKDLLQCADAVMNLRARYLYQNNRKAEITFNFVSGFRCDYQSYVTGNRFSLQQNKWAKTAKEDNSDANFEKYLELVYSYASTLSLEKELKSIKNRANLQIGDVFIKGGSPVHCFIVVDKCSVISSGNASPKVQYAILQGFMPAQDMHLLKNSSGTHWFELQTDYSNDITYGELLANSYHKRFVGE
jgi:hypothetical protein